MKILYLGNKDSNPICRDAMKPYAESLGFEYRDIDSVKVIDLEPYDKIVIDGGWMNSSYLSHIKRILNTDYRNKIVVRLVDDHVGYYTEDETELYWFLHKNHISTISPYMHCYHQILFPVVIPYHYDSEVEVNFIERDRLAILSGFDNPVYKLRSELYKANSSLIDVLRHPGYSGRYWSRGKLGNDFISELSKYKFMVVTTAQDFELLKYIECAEAGCCPIGEFPTSLLKILPEELKELHCYSPNEVIDKIVDYEYDWARLAYMYRNVIKKNRSLAVTKLKYDKLCY